MQGLKLRLGMETGGEQNHDQVLVFSTRVQAGTRSECSVVHGVGGQGVLVRQVLRQHVDWGLERPYLSGRPSNPKLTPYGELGYFARGPLRNSLVHTVAPAHKHRLVDGFDGQLAEPVVTRWCDASR